METRDTVSREDPGPLPLQGSGAPARASLDRFEMKPHWAVRTEEEQVEAAAELYERAIQQWIQPPPPEIPDPARFEELEAMSQELKLQQKCQDIAALIMADEQGLMDGADEEG